MPTVSVVCAKCENTFGRNTDTMGPGECKSCALTRITSGGAPEEGDFNTAMIQSGEYTDQEMARLRQSWKDLEEGRSSSGFEPYTYCQYCSSEDCTCPELFETEEDEDEQK